MDSNEITPEVVETGITPTGSSVVAAATVIN